MTDIVLPTQQGGGGQISTMLANPTAGINPQIWQAAGNPYTQLSKEAKLISDTYIGLQQQQFKYESQVEAQSQLNAFKRDVSNAYVDYVANNQLGNAVENRPKLDAELQRIQKKYNDTVGEKAPLVQWLFDSKSQSILTNTQTDADAYKMQETAKWNASELQNALLLSTEDYAKVYNQDKLAAIAMKDMENSFNAVMENQGVAKGSKTYQQTWLKTRSEINKRLIEDSIGGERFAEAQRLIARESNALLAPDRYDLQNKLRNEMYSASLRNMEMERLKRALAFDPARRIALEQQLFQKFISDPKNQYSLVEVEPGSGEDARGFVQQLQQMNESGAQEVEFEPLARMINADNASEQTIAKTLQGLRRQSESTGKRYYLVPKSSQQLQAEATNFAKSGVIRAEIAANQYTSMENFAKGGLIQLADQMLEQNYIPESVTDVTRFEGMNEGIWKSYVQGGFDGNAERAFQYLRQQLFFDKGNPQKTAEMLSNLSIAGTGYYHGDRTEFMNEAYANNLSLSEINSLTKEWQQAASQAQKGTYNIVRNAVGGTLLNEYDIDTSNKANAVDKVKSDILCNLIYDDVKITAQRLGLVLDNSTVMSLTNDVLTNIGMQEKYHKALDDIDTTMQRLTDQSDQFSDLTPEGWAQLAAVINTDRERYANMPIDQLESELNASQFETYNSKFVKETSYTVPFMYQPGNFFGAGFNNEATIMPNIDRTNR